MSASKGSSGTGSAGDAWPSVLSLISGIRRFSEILPDLAQDSVQRFVLAREGAKLARRFELLSGEPGDSGGLDGHAVLLKQAAGRVTQLVAQVEADIVLGIATIPRFDDSLVFARLRKLPEADIVRLFGLFAGDPAALAPRQRLALHLELVELGVPAGLAIGPVGWIKLILLIFLVLGLIASLFKPELLPAVTALALTLAVIDGIAPPEPAPPPVPPPPPPPPPVPRGYGLIFRDGEWILLPPGSVYEKDGTTIRIPGHASGPPKLYTPEHCTWVTLYPDDGDYHNWDLEWMGLVSDGSSDGARIEIKLDGELQTPLENVGDRRSVTAKKCEIHLNGKEGDRGGVKVWFNW